jgi:choline dehydrogenase-like flavoprotein
MLPPWQVLVVEAGGWDENLIVRMPLGSAFLQRGARDWQVRTERQPQACKAMECSEGGTGCCSWPMGKSLGGGSTINFMAYVRGNPADFDHWEKSGAAGWSYSDVLPYGQAIIIIIIIIITITTTTGTILHHPHVHHDHHLHLHLHHPLKQILGVQSHVSHR